MFLVGPDGKVITRTAQAATVDEELKKIFKSEEQKYWFAACGAAVLTPQAAIGRSLGPKFPPLQSPSSAKCMNQLLDHKRASPRGRLGRSNSTFANSRRQVEHPFRR